MCFDFGNNLLIFISQQQIMFVQMTCKCVTARRKNIYHVKITLARSVRADVGFPIVIF